MELGMCNICGVKPDNTFIHSAWHSNALAADAQRDGNIQSLKTASEGLLNILEGHERAISKVQEEYPA